MSENLKDLIDKAEEEERSRAVLEKTIEKLNNEINRLKTRLEEQNSRTLLGEKATTDSFNESEEITILKNMVSSQRKELAQKDYESEILQKKIDDLNFELSKQKDADKVDPLILKDYTQKIETLTKEYHRLEKNLEPLKNHTSKLEDENRVLRNNIRDLKTELATIAQLEEEMIGLEAKIAELEDNNKLLQEQEKPDVEFIESTRNTISNLMEEVNRLENVIIKKNEKIHELVNETNLLRNNIEFLKMQKPDVAQLEEEIANLQEQVIELEFEKKMIKEKDKKVVEEAISIPQSQEAIGFPPLKPLEVETEQSTEPLLGAEEKITSDTDGLKVKLEEVVPSYTPVNELKSILSPELEKDKQPILEGTSEGRRRCPKCGNTNKTHIREMPDKTHIILAYPRMYGKKYKCGLCGTEWR
jgi:chromosome segregation ATPase